MTDFGLAIRNFVGPGEVPDIDAIYAYAERAEALGFESLWAWDHILLGVEPSFPIIDSITTLGAVAARTSRIKLGTGVLVLPLRNPVVAAKALGSLDVISGGRLVLGVAAGWYAREFDAVGVPFKGRGRIFERNLDILMKLWSQERTTLKADEINLREAVMLPRPVQRQRPQIRRRSARPTSSRSTSAASASRPPPTCGTGSRPSGTWLRGASPPSSTPSTGPPPSAWSSYAPTSPRA
jgi:alkanesulfonate monooxygenase